MTESTVRIARPSLEQAVTAPIGRCDLDGIGAIVRLTGEAGIGKSTLAEFAIGHARQLGLSVWSGAAGEFDRSVTFGAMGSVRSTAGERLLAPEVLSVRAGDSPDGLVRPGVHGHRFDAIESLLAAVEPHCQHPTLLVLDDLQWADPSSLEAVVALAELTRTHPLVLLVSHRSGLPETARLASDLRTLGAIEVDVPPFDDDEVQALLPLLCGGSPGSSLIDRAAGAAGNPFLLHELAAGLLQAGGLVERADLIETVDHGVPPALADVVERELQRSGREIADLLRAAAVQGGDLDVDALSAVLGVPVLQLSEPISAALRANLLEGTDDTIRFRHQLVREAVYETIPAPVRAAIHQQLAGVLAQRGAPAALVGSHLIMSGSGTDDPETVERLRLAAAETAPVDPESARRFLDLAAELCRDDLALRQVIERARVEAYTAAGQLDEAQQLATWLLDTTPDEHAFMPRMRLAGLASLMGDPALALTHLEQAAHAVRTDRERAAVLAASATASLLRGDIEGAHGFATDAQVLAEELGDLVGQSVSVGVLARVAMYRDHVADGLRLAERAVAFADADPSGRAHGFTPCLYAGINALNAGDLDLVDAMAGRGTELAIGRHLGWSLPLYGALAAAGHFHRGELDQAVAEAETVLDLADRTRTTQARLWAEAILTLSLLHTGGPEAARQSYELLRSSLRRGGSQLGLVYGILAQARMRIAEGRVADARAGLEATWDFLGTMGGSTRRPFLALGPFLARVAGRRRRGDDRHDRVDRARLGPHGIGPARGVGRARCGPCAATIGPTRRPRSPTSPPPTGGSSSPSAW